MRGTVFHHEKMVFSDGIEGIKLLILLNFPGGSDPYLCVKTTSQRKSKPVKPGCLKPLSLYFIASGTTLFDKDTWVQLYEIYAFEAEGLTGNPYVRRVGKLDKRVMDEIIDCLFITQDEDIPEMYRRVLKPSAEEALEKLRQKFQRTR